MEGAASRRALGTLFGIVLLDLLGFGLVVPQLGIYAQAYAAPPWLVGLLMATYSLLQLLSAPVLGALSDRYGRRPVLLLSLGGSVVGYVLFAWADSLAWLFAARVLDGITGGNISTAQAYIADVTTAESRAKGMGMVGAAFGLGFVLGPAVGGMLGAWGGNLAIGAAAAGLSALALLATWAWLPESRQQGAAAGERPSVRIVLAVLRLPGLGAALLLSLTFLWGFSMMEGTFSLFLVARHLGAPPGGALAPELARRASWLSGWLFLAVGVVSAVVQGGLIGRLRARWGELRLAGAGLLLVGLGLAGIPAAPSYGWLFLPMAVLALGSALTSPSLSAWVSLRAPADRQGEVLGAYQSMGSLGRLLGPASGGALFSGAGAVAPFAVAAGMMVAGWGMLRRMRHTA
ncbi:MAG: MFS transporter [Deltaproteobacteria bacterium]|nr:MFS transporter [Deltaproteobacteria bacterium]